MILLTIYAVVAGFAYIIYVIVSDIIFRFIGECESADSTCNQNLESSSSNLSERESSEEAEEISRTQWIIKSPYSGNRLHFHHVVADRAGAISYLTNTVLPKIYESM
jgi:hypothetical protein